MNYNKHANTYDAFRFARKSIVDSIVAKIKSSNYKTILDFGCGTGNHIYEIAKRMRRLNLIGVEPSESMREIARKKNPKVTIVKGNHLSVPLDENSVDMIYMVDVIHHVDNIEKMFFELNRVLKNQGNILIITVSHKQIQEKAWLSYFDGAKDISLNILPDISEIVRTAKKIGLNCYEEITIDEIPYNISINELISLVSNKAFSILHKISDKSYEKGLQKLKKDSLIKKHILRHIAKTILCFKKSALSAV